MEEIRNLVKILTRKYEGKSAIWRPRCRLNNENYDGDKDDDDDDDDDDGDMIVVVVIAAVVVVVAIIIIIIIIIILKKQPKCGLTEKRNQWKVLMGIVMKHQVLQNFHPFAKKSVLVGYNSASAVYEIWNDWTGPLDHLR